MLSQIILKNVETWNCRETQFITWLMIKVVRQLTNVITCVINWSIFWRQICFVGFLFLWNAFRFPMNEKHSLNCYLTITALELHFNYYLDNNNVLKQFGILGTCRHNINRDRENKKLWRLGRWFVSCWAVTAEWSEGCLIYIIWEYLQWELITWSDYPSRRQLKILSQQNCGPGRTGECRGQETVARGQTKCEEWGVRSTSYQWAVIVSIQTSPSVLPTFPIDICRVSCCLAQPGQLTARGEL